MTPQLRTRQRLTEMGYLVATVETKKRFPDKKKHQCKACGHLPMIEVSVDLWNVFDIIAVKPGESEFLQTRHNPVVFVQTTTRANHSTRRNKILASMEAKLVLLSGASILIQSWRQEGGEGSRWQCFDEWITLDMYDSAPHYPNTVAELMEIKRKARKPSLPKGSTLPIPTEDFDELAF